MGNTIGYLTGIFIILSNYNNNKKKLQGKKTTGKTNAIVQEVKCFQEAPEGVFIAVRFKNSFYCFCVSQTWLFYIEKSTSMKPV